MNAGEAVYQGREGTGLAQVLNWKEYRPVQQKGIDPLQLQRFRLQQRAADDKKIEDFTKFDKGYEWFNEQHQRDANQLNQAIADDLNKGVSPEQAIASRRNIKDQISLQIKKGLSAAETYKRKKAEFNQVENLDVNRAIPFLNDTLFPEKDKDGKIDFNRIDENLAQSIEVHPSVFDAKGAVLGSASKIKNQIELGEVDPEMFRGNNGAFFEKKLDKWRFRVDPTTGQIADEVIDFYSNDPKVYDRILWDKIAQKEGVLADGRILQDERNKIDDLFNQERLNPKWAPDVKSEIRSYLNQVQGEVHRTDKTSAGRDLNPYANSGNSDIKASVIEGDKRQFRKFDEVATDQNGVTSYGQFSVPYNSGALSNLEGVYPGQVATFTGVKTDPNTGKPTATFTDKNGFELPPMEWNQETIARLNNVAKSKGESGSISKLINEVSTASKKQKNTYVDEPVLDQKTKDLEAIMFKKNDGEFDVNEDREGYAEKLNQFFKQNDIEATVDVDRNYGAQWLTGGPYIKINDEKFDLSESADKKKLKSFLYNLKPSKFSKESKVPNTPTQSPIPKGKVR